MTNTPSPALPSNVEELRRKFETWVKRERKLEPDSYQIERMGDGYYDAWTDAAWDGWKAARASTPTEKEADDADDMRTAVTDAITRARQVNWKNGGVLASDADEFIESLLRDIDRIRPRARSLQKRPVAFRVQDAKASSGYMLFYDERDASRFAEEHACEYQGLYARDGSPTPPAHGEGELREAARNLVQIAECYIPDAEGSELVDAVNEVKMTLSHAPSPPQIDKELECLLIDVGQLLDGWHADVAWSEWDEEVRWRVSCRLMTMRGLEPLSREIFSHTDKAPSPPNFRLVMAARKISAWLDAEAREGTDLERDALHRELDTALTFSPSPPQKDGSGLVEALQEVAHTLAAEEAFGDRMVERLKECDGADFDQMDRDELTKRAQTISYALEKAVNVLASTPKASDHAPARAESVTQQDSLTEAGNG